MNEPHAFGQMVRELKLAAIRARDRVILADGVWPYRRAWPVRCARGAAAPNPFFVVGHPRSGTTLLRAMLSRHSQIFLPPENDALWRMIREFARVRKVSWETVVGRLTSIFEQGYEFRHWGLDRTSIQSRLEAIAQPQRSLAELIHQLYILYGERHFPGKALWGDKTTPGDFTYLDKIDLVFPNARYIHIVRDGRDCVVSGIKAGFFDRDYPTAARAWRDNVRICRSIGVRSNDRRQLHQMRYEELVAEPKTVLRPLCDFLGVAFEPEMIEHQSAVDRVVPEMHAISHHQNLAKPVFTQSVGRWKGSIPVAVRQEVLEILGPELSAAGYQ